MGGLYLPRVYTIVCSLSLYACSRHEWTHSRVDCICLECAIYVLFCTLGMSGSISEWVVSALSMYHCGLIIILCMLTAWVDPSLGGLYLPWKCIVYSCYYIYSRHEWTVYMYYLLGVCIIIGIMLSMLCGPICKWNGSALSKWHCACMLYIVPCTWHTCTDFRMSFKDVSWLSLCAFVMLSDIAKFHPGPENKFGWSAVWIYLNQLSSSM